MPDLGRMCTPRPLTLGNSAKSHRPRSPAHSRWGARRLGQRADVLGCLPTLGAAAVAPALHRLFDGLGTVANEVVGHVDNKHYRPLAESAALAIPGQSKDPLVTFSKEPVPHTGRHWGLLPR